VVIRAANTVDCDSLSRVVVPVYNCIDMERWLRRPRGTLGGGNRLTRQFFLACPQ
jgi:hypothetical protein